MVSVWTGSFEVGNSSVTGDPVGRSSIVTGEAEVTAEVGEAEVSAEVGEPEVTEEVGEPEVTEEEGEPEVIDEAGSLVGRSIE